MVKSLARSLSADSANRAGDPVLLNDWHVLARSQDLPVGALLPAKLLDTDLVLWRGADGQVHAWDDRCPHRSVRLSTGRVVDNGLVCNYHGLVFNEAGRCVSVPAHPDYVPPKQACVRTYRAQERYGLIYVCLGEPTQDIPLFPEWAEPGYHRCLSGPYHGHTGGLRAIENFLDVSHFPFVHAGTLGDPSKTTVADYEVSTDDRGVWLHDIRVWQPDPDGQGQGTFVTYNYWVWRPLTAYLRKQTPEGNCLTILFHVTPVTEEECIGWMWVAMNYAHDTPETAMREFQDHLILEDFAKLEAHNPKRLPLDMQSEFHLPCDRGSLAYRKWLRQLGLVYGVEPADS